MNTPLRHPRAARALACALALAASSFAFAQTYRQIPLDCAGWLSGLAQHSASGRLYAYGDAFGVYRSDNRGITWTNLNGYFVANTTAGFGLAVAKTNADTVYFHTSDSLWKSTDGGATWTLKASAAAILNGRSGLPDRNRGSMPLVVDPSNDNAVWLAAAVNGVHGLYRSLNGGDSWNRLASSTFNSTVRPVTIALRAEFPNQVWVGSTDGLWVSVDGGSTFTRVWNNNNATGGTARDVNTIARTAAGPGVIGTNNGFWQVTATDYANPATYSVVQRGHSGWQVAATTALADDSLVVSTTGYTWEPLARLSGDGGTTWVDLPMSRLAYPTPSWTSAYNITQDSSVFGRDQILQDSQDPRRWYITGGLAPAVSVDAGRTWAYDPTGIGGVITRVIHVSTANPGHVYIGGSDVGVSTIEDGGASGDAIVSSYATFRELQQYSSIMEASDGQTVMAGGIIQGSSQQPVIIRSDDAGGNWRKVSFSGLPTNANTGIIRAVMSRSNKNDILVAFGGTTGTNGAGLYRSTSTTEPLVFSPVSGVPSGLDVGSLNGHPMNLIVDGGNTSRRYAAFRATGFLRSDDNGANWTSIASTRPFGSDWIWFMSGDPLISNRLWACGGDAIANPLKFSSDGGDTWTTVSGFIEAWTVNAHNDRVAVYGRRTGDTENKIYYRPDAATAWASLNTASMRLAVGKSENRLAVDPSAPGRVWFGNRSALVINPPAPPAAVAPAAPTGLSAVAGNRQVRLAWNEVGGATHYVVTRTGDGSTVTFDRLLATTYVDVTALNGVAYSYSVAGVNSAGAGSGSSPVGATPASPSVSYEPFNYTAGSTALAGKSGGFGWSGAWDAGANGVASGGLSYSSAGSLVASGNRAEIKNGVNSFRSLGSARPEGDTWIAAVVQSGNPGAAWAGISLFEGATERFFIGQRYNSSVWGMERTGASSASTTVNSGVQTLLVARVVQGPASDDVYLWVNPPLDRVPNIGAASASLVGVSNFNFDRVRLGSGLGTNKIFTVDELRVGGSFSEVAPAAGATREWWTGIVGDTVATLTGAAAYPNSPSGRDVLPSLRATNWANPAVTSNWGDTYGQRIRGFLLAPETGAYSFWIAADDQAELWLSSDDNPANRVRVSLASAWTGVDEWNKYASQRSASINLVAGRRYYLEVLHKEAWGGDNLSVGWRKPSDGAGSTPAEIVPGSAATTYLP